MSVAVSPQWATIIPAAHASTSMILAVTPGPTGVTVGQPTGVTGAVTDDWVSGGRRSLQLTLPNTALNRSLIQPGIELVISSGLVYGTGSPELVVMGRFPLTDTSVSITPSDAISVSATDRWQWVVQATFLVPTASDTTLMIRDQIAALIVDTGQWTLNQITNTATSTAMTTAVTWDSDRSQACMDLATSIGAEVLIGRDGNPVIQDRQALAGPVVALRLRDGGRILTLKETLSTADVYNVVAVVSSSSDPALTPAPVVISITDPTHPAYPRPGVPTKPYRLSSAQFTTTAQMTAAGQKILTKISAPARSLALTCIADPSLDAADTVSIQWPDGTTEPGQIQQVVHPLNPSDSQQLTTVSTRSDEDFNP